MVLRHQPLTLLVAVGTLGLTVYLYIIVPKGFFPVQDTGAILGISQAPETVSFSAMSRLQQELVQVIRQDPAVENLTSFIGADGVNTTMNSGRIQITLKPLEERAGVSAVDVIRRLQPKVQQVAGIELFMQPVQDLTVEDRISRTQYQYSLDAPDKALLDQWAPRLVERMKQLPELRDVASDQQNNGLRAAGQYRSRHRRAAGHHAAEHRRRALRCLRPAAGLHDLYADQSVPRDSGSGAAVPAGCGCAGGHVRADRIGVGQSGLDHRAGGDEYRSHGRRGAGAGSAAIVCEADPWFRPRLRSTTRASSRWLRFRLIWLRARRWARRCSISGRSRRNWGCRPASKPSFQGTAHAFESSLANESTLILAAIVTVYIVLGVLYESFIHPITILSTLPSAGVGAILALVLFKKDLDVIALIGIILLIGIVKKNAIMMIDFALEAERKEGKPPEEAIYQACLLRFRPIMMTTMAALLGAVPLAFGSGVGSELRKPLGICIIGGLLVSQVLTLFTTPVIYLFFGRAAAWVGRSRGSEQARRTRFRCRIDLRRTL